MSFLFSSLDKGRKKQIKGKATKLYLTEPKVVLEQKDKCVICIVTELGESWKRKLCEVPVTETPC